MVGDLCALCDPGPPHFGASASETTAAPSQASFQETLRSLHGKLQKSLRSAHGKSGASKLVRAKLDCLLSLSFILPCLAARTGGNTNQISPSEMCAGIRVHAHASSTKVVDLWFSDLEPFSFHFQPQGLHGDLLMVARAGGRWCCGQAVCVFFPLSQSVGLLCPLTSRKNGLSFTPELHHYCRKCTETFPGC